MQLQDLNIYLPNIMSLIMLAQGVKTLGTPEQTDTLPTVSLGTFAPPPAHHANRAKQRARERQANPSRGSFAAPNRFHEPRTRPITQTLLPTIGLVGGNATDKVGDMKTRTMDFRHTRCSALRMTNILDFKT
jgi:hypothetical protein